MLDFVISAAYPLFIASAFFGEKVAFEKGKEMEQSMVGEKAYVKIPGRKMIGDHRCSSVRLLASFSGFKLRQ
jgi:hypothetical protein